MTLSLDTRSMGSPILDGSLAHPNVSASPRSGLSSSYPRLPKHRRRPSNASTASTNSPPVTQFPIFDPTFENSQTTPYYNTPPHEPLPLFKQTRGDSVGHGHGSSFSKKIKPLVKYSGTSMKEKKPIDLNLSKAENEERGAYIADSPPMTSDSTQGNAHTGMYSTQTPRTAARTHSRTVSGTSQISSSSAHSGHRTGATYYHPARQMPHSPTPPVPSTLFDPPGALRSQSSHSSLTNIPSLPPANHYRTSNLFALRSQASTPTNPPTPALIIPSAPATARSSFDSAFRDRVSFTATRRSRRPSRNTEPMGIEEQQAEIIRLRQEFAKTQEKKNEKYRLQEEKRAREEEKKARRKIEAVEKSKRQHANRTRGDSDGTAETTRTGDSDWMGADAAISPSSRRGQMGSIRSSADQLSAIGYASTSELGRPKMGRRVTTEDGVDGDEEEVVREKAPIPKRQKTQGAASAGKAARSRWSLFWFQVKTLLLKAFRK